MGQKFYTTSAGEGVEVPVVIFPASGGGGV